MYFGYCPYVRWRVSEYLFLFLFCFVLLTMYFALQELFSFMRSHLLIVDLSGWAIGVLFRNLSPVPMCSRQFLTFFSIRFSVSGFMLRSLIHMDLNFVRAGRYGSICFLLPAGIQWDKHHLLKMLLFFHVMVLVSWVLYIFWILDLYWMWGW